MTNKKSNLITNTGERFISLCESSKCYSITFKTPFDERIERSVGFERLGKKKAMRKAVKMRNELGIKEWGTKCWKLLLNDPYLLTRLPHSLEPELVSKNGTPYYRSIFEDGKRRYVSKLFSTKAHGTLGAYAQAKRVKLEMYKEWMPIFKKINRFTVISFS